jgi:uncharacterized protein
MQPIEATPPPNSRIWPVLHHPGFRLLIGIACVAGAIGLSTLVNTVLRVQGDPWRSVLLSCVVAAIFVGVYAAFCRWFEHRPVVEFATRGWASQLLIGIVMGAAIFSAVVGVIAAFGGYQVLATRGPEVLVPALAIAIVSGFTEEIVFRGIVFRLSEEWLGSWGALAISAALFGGLHLGNHNATWFAAVAIAFEAGILLAALYMITRTLWAPIGLHAAWNFVEGGVYSIPISGGNFNGLLVPRITGSDLLTGGAFGAEASVPALVVATAAGLIMVLIAHQSGRFVQPRWERRRQLAAAGAAPQA